ncbi:MAG: HAD-IIIA family hydrolase [Lachnospiraceae bacterium]|nr:HAD-IIIA family hydrolase [Lachnospiraceae bacterium]
MSKARPAVFLDRDGVINKDSGYINSLEELEIFPFTKQCIDEFHRLGYLAIVISNQSGVARGYLTEDTLREINEYIKNNTGVDAIYYCPYHEEGIISEYTKKSDWRKPGTGMIKQACSDFHVDMSRSLLAGDRASDIKTGQNAGITTILLESGFGTTRLEEEVTPDYIMEDLRDVVRFCKEKQAEG